MENNSFILGRIPGSGSGIRKTYEESMIIELSSNDSIINLNIESRKKLLINKKTREITYSNNISDDIENYKELEVLAMLPYTYGSSRTYYLCEVIEKDILHRHLVEERMIIEEQIKAGLVSREQESTNRNGYTFLK